MDQQSFFVPTHRYQPAKYTYFFIKIHAFVPEKIKDVTTLPVWQCQRK